LEISVSKIEFKPGEFLTFKATTKFHLGTLERDVEEGEELDFDGTTVKLSDGQTHSIAKLRGCIRAGWLALAGEEAPRYRPKPAGIQVRAADPMKAQAEGTAAKFSMENVADEETVVTSTIGGDSGAQIGDQSRIAPEHAITPKQASITGGVIGAQEGKQVASIGGATGAAVGAEGTAGMAEGTMVTASNIGRLRSEQTQREQQFGNRTIESGKGKGLEELDNLDPAVKARMIERRQQALEAEKKAMEGDEEDDDAIDFGLLDDPEPEPVNASPPKKKKLSKKAQKKEAPKKEAPKKEAPKKEPVKVDWDMTRHWTKRVKDAVENYADKPRHLRKILAMEKPSVATKIQDKLEELGL
jgi:hypothetical protein